MPGGGGDSLTLLEGSTVDPLVKVDGVLPGYDILQRGSGLGLREQESSVSISSVMRSALWRFRSRPSGVLIIPSLPPGVSCAMT